MRRNQSSFTLLELLIVIGILSLVAVAVLVLLNPWQQIGKGWDARRKHDLDVLKKVLEDWYNDKGCYPRADQICFDTALSYCAPGNKKILNRTCHICGLDSSVQSAAANSNFSSYLNNNKLPCDPQHPQKDYLYQVEVPGCTIGGTCAASNCAPDYCPSWYRLYANLSNKNDLQSQELGCIKGGCGLDRSTTYFPSPTPPFGYDYAISNGKVLYEYSSQYTCLFNNGDCNGCGGNNDYNSCANNPTCRKDKIYGTGQACCLANPGAGGC